MPHDKHPTPAVLVVEDEPLLRMTAVDLVEEAGFVAWEAAGAQRAVALLERHQDIRIVFTDIDLPGGDDGLKLAATIRLRWPPVDFIITSGHLRPATADMPDGSVFLTKPYSHHRLVEAMRAMAG